ncbi:MAG: tetratricopeptide repeat protein [Elusimicrobiota bacterium]
MSGCENQNIFSWTHRKGAGGSTEFLLADAMKAMEDGDYDRAIEYFNEILEDDPDNAEALYGKAAAELKKAGFDLEELVTKFIGEEGSSEDDLLGTFNLEDVEEGSGNAADALKKIADGQADGSIPADDFDVNVNLGIALTLHAASDLLLWAQDSGTVEIKDNFSVDIIDDSVSGLKEELQDARDEVNEAINYLNVAQNSSDADISDVMDGIETLKDELDKKISSL